MDEICKKKCQKDEVTLQESLCHGQNAYQCPATVDNEDSVSASRGQDATWLLQESSSLATVDTTDSLSTWRGQDTAWPSQEAPSSATVDITDSLSAWRGQDTTWPSQGAPSHSAVDITDSVSAWRGQDTAWHSQEATSSAPVSIPDSLSAWRRQDTTWTAQEASSSLHPCFVAHNIDHPDWFGVFMTTLQLPIGVNVTIKEGCLFVSALNGHTGQLKVGDKLIQINGHDVTIETHASAHQVQCLYEKVQMWLSKQNIAQLVVKRKRRGERQQRIDRRERSTNIVNSFNQTSLLPPFTNLCNFNGD